MCDYGCNRSSKFQMRNGKWCCEKFWQSCPTIREKQSKLMTGSKKIRKFVKIVTSDLCEYGCGRIAKYKFPNKKLCCEKHFSKCSVMRKKHSKSMIGKIGYWTGKKRNFSKKWKMNISMSMRGKRRKHSEETKKKMSISQKEIRKDPELRKKLSKSATEKYRNNPELKEILKNQMLNGGAVHALSGNKNPSKPQVELFNLVKEIYPETILEFPVYETNNSIDIVIPGKMIAIEYDGSYWHQDKEADDIRQKQLENLGWKFIRYEDYIPNKEELLKDINKIKEID